ncbi:hypothetical protein GL50803_0014583 [Giardia duodenalis]|uniref:Uncharacterized protein n=1 Tax=Giardia intestinalis (strain ATCC 50803 / WB clone C6) TaxID=184922 RepID=A0A644F4F4_GIAIC|nr:hypothetical protein GL50803_0014583 [Giardia intestinalis]KAE8303080.1 hypothetical protein GL50803_0014583 [Giardia intestinalis]
MAETYNLQPGPPRVLIGNWVEEKAFWDAKKAYQQRLANGEEILEPACQTLELQAGSLFLDQEFCTTNNDYGDFTQSNKPVYGKPQVAPTSVAAAQLAAAKKEETCALLDQTKAHDIFGTSGKPLASNDDMLSVTRSTYYKDELDPRPRLPLFEEHIKLYNTSRRKCDGSGPVCQ